MKSVWNQKLYPLVAILSGVFVIVFGLVMAKDLLACSVFLACVFVWLMIFGCWKSCLHALPAFIVVAGIFFGIFYMSFVPMLKGEIGRVREAMKTRGAGSILNPKILYRAFLVPFVMRLVNISDTLALSVETRGFALGKVRYTIYKKESLAISDIVYVLGLIAGAVLVVVL